MMHGRRQLAQHVVQASLLVVLFCACAHSVESRRDQSDVLTTGKSVGGLRNGPWTNHYASAQKQSAGSYLNDVQDGLWTYWFENGNKEMEGRFAQERRDGEWKWWHENGALRIEGRFERGFEEGQWRFYSSSGALESEGAYDQGKQALRWTYFHPSGALRATGHYRAGIKVGTWTTFDAAGNETKASYPFPDQCELIEEFFAPSTVKRTGFLRNGVPEGRWMSFHPSGKLRMECSFANGLPNGRAHAWRDDGALIASGSLKDGCVHDAWTFARGSSQETLDFEQARPRQVFSGEWSASDSGEHPGCTVVETWIAEISSPLQAAPTPSSPAAQAPASAPPVAAQDAPLIPTRAQPWTEYELKALPELVKRYTTESKSALVGNDDWSTESQWHRSPKPITSAITSADLLGRTLPLRRFVAADGGTINLDDYAGKKNVLVTILRGFGGQVCVYCEAQTRALAQCADKFAAQDTEVVIIYPGPRGDLDAFLEAYRRTFDAKQPPYRLLYDADLALTRALGIEDNIAVPTSIVLDRSGIIRWCHVAKDIADRPSAQEILDRIAELQTNGVKQ